MIKKRVTPRIVSKNIESTLGIIKPDAYQRKIIGKILAMVEESGLEIKKLAVEKLSPTRAKAFYAVHKKRLFFPQLVNYMCSGKIVAFEATGENAIKVYRELIGDTNPKEAKRGTIRHKFGIDKEKNTVHGSDSKANAVKEIRFFFGR